jgi:hypothetical protein
LTCYFRMLLAAVVSAHLGRNRREHRCGAGVERGLLHAHSEGPGAARSSAKWRNGLAEHEKDPVTWEAPLPKALKATNTESDAELIAAVRALLALADEAGSGRGEYIAQAWGNQGVQIGDNRQDNTFGAP